MSKRYPPWDPVHAVAVAAGAVEYRENAELGADDDLCTTGIVRLTQRGQMNEVKYRPFYGRRGQQLVLLVLGLRERRSLFRAHIHHGERSVPAGFQLNSIQYTLVRRVQPTSSRANGVCPAATGNP